jgi:hypothetical protein
VGEVHLALARASAASGAASGASASGSTGAGSGGGGSKLKCVVSARAASSKPGAKSDGSSPRAPADAATRTVTATSRRAERKNVRRGRAPDVAVAAGAINLTIRSIPMVLC